MPIASNYISHYIKMSTPFIVQKESVLYGSIFISYFIYGLLNILETLKSYKDKKENEKKSFHDEIEEHIKNSSRRSGRRQLEIARESVIELPGMPKIIDDQTPQKPDLEMSEGCEIQIVNQNEIVIQDCKSPYKSIIVPDSDRYNEDKINMENL